MNSNFDPNAQTQQAAGEAPASNEAAQESAAQDQAMEATQDSEEGGTEG